MGSGYDASHEGVKRHFMVSLARATTGQPQHTLRELLLNAALAGGSTQISSLTPMITQGPLKGKEALRKKINTITKRVF